jgi:plastocyanin
MRFSTIFAAFASVAAVSAQQTFDVLVGANNTLTFQPDTITAAVGDRVAFTFVAKNHTLTQSTFASPCTNISSPMTGIDTGYVFTPTNATSFQQFSITVNVSTPLWFYCRQTTHCQKGMVFAINPTADKSFGAFQANAMGMGTASSSSSSGANPTATGTASASGSAASASSSSKGSAMRLRGSTAGLVTLLGLIAGLTF